MSKNSKGLIPRACMQNPLSLAKIVKLSVKSVTDRLAFDEDFSSPKDLILARAVIDALRCNYALQCMTIENDSSNADQTQTLLRRLRREEQFLIRFLPTHNWLSEDGMPVCHLWALFKTEMLTKVNGRSAEQVMGKLLRTVHSKQAQVVHAAAMQRLGFALCYSDLTLKHADMETACFQSMGL